MFSRTHSTVLSFTLSTMISASFLSTAPTGHINAGAGGEMAPALLQQAAAAAHAAGFPVPTDSTSRPLAEPTAMAVDLPSTKSNFNGMTDAQESKFELYFQKYKGNIPLAPGVIQLLGLGKPGEVITVQEFKGIDPNDNTRAHICARGLENPNIEFFMLRDVSKNVFYGYMVDSKFNLIQAYVSADVLQKLSAAEGRTGLAAELAWWAKTMDNAPNLPVNTASK
jgi:hypothetical protein